jgi:hypothetical protein
MHAAALLLEEGKLVAGVVCKEGGTLEHGSGGRSGRTGAVSLNLPELSDVILQRLLVLLKVCKLDWLPDPRLLAAGKASKVTLLASTAEQLRLAMVKL